MAINNFNGNSVSKNRTMIGDESYVFATEQYVLPQQFPILFDNVTLYNNLTITGERDVLINNCVFFDKSNITISGSVSVVINNTNFGSNIFFIFLYDNAELIIMNDYHTDPVFHVYMYNNSRLFLENTSISLDELVLYQNAECYINNNYDNTLTTSVIYIYNNGKVNYRNSLVKNSISIRVYDNSRFSTYNMSLNVYATILAYSTSILSIENTTFPASSDVYIYNDQANLFKNVTLDTFELISAMGTVSIYNSTITNVIIRSGKVSHIYNSTLQNLECSHIIHGSALIDSSGNVHPTTGTYYNSTEIDGDTTVSAWFNNSRYFLYTPAVTVENSSLDVFYAENGSVNVINSTVSELYLYNTTANFNKTSRIIYGETYNATMYLDNTSISTLYAFNSSCVLLVNTTATFINSNASDIAIYNTTITSPLNINAFGSGIGLLSIYNSTLTELNLYVNEIQSITVKNSNVSYTNPSYSNRIENTDVLVYDTFWDVLNVSGSTGHFENVTCQILEFDENANVTINGSVINTLVSLDNAFVNATHSTITTAKYHVRASDGVMDINALTISVHSEYYTSFVYKSATITNHNLYNITIVNGTLNMINFYDNQATVYGYYSTVNITQSNVSTIDVVYSTVYLKNMNFSYLYCDNSSANINNAGQLFHDPDPDYDIEFELFNTTITIENSNLDDMNIVNSTISILYSWIDDIKIANSSIYMYESEAYMIATGNYNPFQQNNNVNVTNSKLRGPLQIQSKGDFFVRHSNISEVNAFPDNLTVVDHSNITTLKQYPVYTQDGSIINNTWNNISYNVTQLDGTSQVTGSTTFDGVLVLNGSLDIYNSTVGMTVSMGTGNINVNTSQIMFAVAKENGSFWVTETNFISGFYSWENAEIHIFDANVTFQPNAMSLFYDAVSFYANDSIFYISSSGAPAFGFEDTSAFYANNLTIVDTVTESAPLYCLDNTTVYIEDSNITGFIMLGNSQATVYNTSFSHLALFGNNAYGIIENPRFINESAMLIVGATAGSSGIDYDETSSSEVHVTNASTNTIELAGMSMLYLNNVTINQEGLKPKMVMLHHNAKIIADNLTTDFLILISYIVPGFAKYSLFTSIEAGIVMNNSIINSVLSVLYHVTGVGDLSLNNDTLATSASVNFNNLTKVSNTLTPPALAYGLFLDGLMNVTIKNYKYDGNSGKLFSSVFINSSYDYDPPVIETTNTSIEFEEDMNIALVNLTLYDKFPDKYVLYKNDVAIDQGSYFNGTVKSLNVTDYGAGFNNITVFANDTSGYETVLFINVTVVSAANPVFISVPLGTIYIKQGTTYTLVWNYADWASELKRVLTDNGTVLVNETSSEKSLVYEFNGSTVGLHELSLTLYDYANHYNSNIVRIYVDSAPPVFTEVPSNMTMYVNESMFLNWTATDMYPENYTVYVNGTEKASGIWESGVLIQYTFSPTETGTYNITIVITDKVGNKAASTVFINVTTAPPPPRPPPPPPPYQFDLLTIGLAIGIVIIVIIAILIYMKKRRTRT